MNSAKAKGWDDKTAKSPELAILAKAIGTLTLKDFDSCREAARKVSQLNFGIYREMVERYDPKDKDGFADLISYFSSLFNDKREAAEHFGISVSTFYRWKGGETIPHALMRSSIRDSIRRYLAERTYDSAEFTLLGYGGVTGDEGRLTPH